MDWKGATAPATRKPIFVATMYKAVLPQDGMFMATSADGVNFTNAADGDSPFYAPSTGVRDPAILFYSSDGGQHWTEPTLLTFKGFRDVSINWAQVALFTDSSALAAVSRLAR